MMGGLKKNNNNTSSISSLKMQYIYNQFESNLQEQDVQSNCSTPQIYQRPNKQLIKVRHKT